MIIGLLLWSNFLFTQHQSRPVNRIDKNVLLNSIDDQFTPEQLVDELLLNSNCINVSNVRSQGQSGIGYFQQSQYLNIGIPSGVVLTTGSLSQLEGPNTGTSDASSDNNNPNGDADLEALFNVTTTNAVTLEFDFIPTADKIAFTMVFASEEYPEYVCSGFNDVVGVFVNEIGNSNADNYAFIPGTKMPISINSLNNGSPGSQGSSDLCISLNHSNLFEDNLAPNSPDTRLDGYSKPITVQIEGLNTCAQYRIKFAIADSGDSVMDSALFIGSNSLVDGSGLQIDALGYNQIDDLAVEGCHPSFFRFTRPANYPVDVPYTLNLTYGGTATAGDDYAALPASITIPAGEMEYLLDVEVYLDTDLFEPTETIIVTTEIKDCSCARAFISSTLTILNRQPYTIDTAICEGETYTLPDGKVVDSGVGGSYTGIMPEPDPNYPDCDFIYYALITVAPVYDMNVDLNFCPDDTRELPNGETISTEGEYEVLYESQAGCDSLVTYHVSFREDIVEEQKAEICEGEEYVLPGTLEIVNPSPGEYNYNWTGLTQYGCDSIINTHLTVYDAFEEYLNKDLCEGEVYRGPDGMDYNKNTQKTFVYTSLRTGCDSLVYMNLRFHPPYKALQASAIINFCEGSSTTLPDGREVSQPGKYSATFQNQYGCDSTVIYQVNEILTEREDVNYKRCGLGEYTLPGGDVVTEPGIYIDTLVSALGCDLIVTTEIEEFNIVLASAFTPNRNGQNDFMFVSNPEICGVEQIELNVYNRYGELIFESRDIQNRWDGSDRNGEPAPAGLYLVTGKAVMRDELGNEKTVKIEGGTTLIR